MNTPPPGTQVVLYARFSPRPDAEQSESANDQLATLRDYAKRHGWIVVGEFSDSALSGDDYDRVGLWDAVQAVKRGQLLLATRGSRIARDTILLEMVFEKVRKKRASVWIAEGMLNGNSPESVLLRKMLAAVWEFEKRMIAAQTRAAKIAGMKAGRAVSRDLPFGYREGSGIPSTRLGKPIIRRTMIECDREHPVLKRIITEHLAGRSAQAIAVGLERDKIPARAGRWTRGKIAKIVRRWQVTGLGGIEPRQRERKDKPMPAV